jgi:hypothetical protein
MSEERRKILDMLAEGKIDVNQAEQLLSAIGKSDEMSVNKTETDTITSPKSKPKYLIINVNGNGEGHHKHEKVNVRVPLQIIRAGVKIASVMPKGTTERIHEKLHEKGINIDLDDLDPKHLDELIEALTEFSIDVDDHDEKVRIYCE